MTLYLVSMKTNFNNYYIGSKKEANNSQGKNDFVIQNPELNKFPLHGRSLFVSFFSNDLLILWKYFLKTSFLKKINDKR